jgi:structure-specific recognition protein 1
VTPRGRYSIQMTSNYFRMQGAQYDYKILYTDISALFLLPKPDEMHTAFVISLDKPIRQGNQKYQHLVLETTRVDYTINVNLTEDEIVNKYDNQLSSNLTMPMCNLYAKIFKVLSQSTVIINTQVHTMIYSYRVYT